MTNYHSHFGIYGYIKQDNKLLLIKKARGPYQGLLDLPGGSPNQGETNLQTLVREIKEETNLEVIEAKKLFDEVITLNYHYKINNKDYILKHSALFYQVKKFSGEIKTSGNFEDSNGALWLEKSELTKISCSRLVVFLIEKLK